MSATPNDNIRPIEISGTATEDSALFPEHIAMVEERLEEHRSNPESALSLEQMDARLRSRFPQGSNGASSNLS